MDNFNNPSTSIKKWAIDDRPREKMRLKGAHALSDSELIAILLNNGNKEKSAVELAKDILKLGSNNLVEVGKLIVAALELGNRRQVAGSLDKPQIKSSRQLADYLGPLLKHYAVEVFAVVFLNNANKIKYFEIISKGGITATVADPRIILKKALENDATQIVLCHNHPSGSLKPSKSDEELTRNIIISEEGYYSFTDEGLL
jgi:DNA repair protein RadC